mmetsp:Transcript_70641/g.196507  ORF Transcript_70641/g.196507 Transcript_70641/m.196507 type:complete len:298 (-) Transcript_70641:736-1629(-)
MHEYRPPYEHTSFSGGVMASQVGSSGTSVQLALFQRLLGLLRCGTLLLAGIVGTSPQFAAIQVLLEGAMLSVLNVDARSSQPSSKVGRVSSVGAAVEQGVVLFEKALKLFALYRCGESALELSSESASSSSQAATPSEEPREYRRSILCSSFSATTVNLLCISSVNDRVKVADPPPNARNFARSSSMPFCTVGSAYCCFTSKFIDIALWRTGFKSSVSTLQVASSRKKADSNASRVEHRFAAGRTNNVLTKSTASCAGVAHSTSAGMNAGVRVPSLIADFMASAVEPEYGNSPKSSM